MALSWSTYAVMYSIYHIEFNTSRTSLLCPDINGDNLDHIPKTIDAEFIGQDWQVKFIVSWGICGLRSRSYGNSMSRPVKQKKNNSRDAISRLKDKVTTGYTMKTLWHVDAWWRHQMGTFPALPGLCAGNSPVTGEFLLQRPVTRSSGVFSDLCLNKRLSKLSRRWWFETASHSLWRHCNALRIADLLHRESAGHRGIPLTKA